MVKRDKTTKVILSNGVLEKKPMAKLVEIHNELNPDKPVKKFKNKTVAARAILELLARPPKPKKDRYYVKINYPFKGKIKPYSLGTKRATLIAMLRKGTTRKQIEEVLGWGLTVARQNIRIVHRVHGYGIKEDDQGVLRLISR